MTSSLRIDIDSLCQSAGTACVEESVS